MSVYLKPGTTVPVECDAPGGGKIIYHLRVPTVDDRIQLKAGLTRLGARQHGRLAILNRLYELVEAVMSDSPPDVRDERLTEIKRRIEAWEEFSTEGGAATYDLDNPEQRAEWGRAYGRMVADDMDIADIERMVAAKSKGFAQMLADDEIYFDKLGYEVARLFMEDCDGIPEFNRRPFGASDDWLARIPQSHFSDIGLRYWKLIQPSPAEAKNSESPSSATSGLTHSTAEPMQPETTQGRKGKVGRSQKSESMN